MPTLDTELWMQEDRQIRYSFKKKHQIRNLFDAAYFDHNGLNGDMTSVFEKTKAT